MGDKYEDIYYGFIQQEFENIIYSFHNLHF